MWKKAAFNCIIEFTIVFGLRVTAPIHGFCTSRGNNVSLRKFDHTIHYNLIVLDREFATTFRCFHCIVPSSLMSSVIVLVMTFHIAPNHIAHVSPLFASTTQHVRSPNYIVTK